jgi:hypothetical protein
MGCYSLLLRELAAHGWVNTIEDVVVPQHSDLVDEDADVIIGSLPYFISDEIEANGGGGARPTRNRTKHFFVCSGKCG